MSEQKKSGDSQREKQDKTDDWENADWEIEARRLFHAELDQADLKFEEDSDSSDYVDTLLRSTHKYFFAFKNVNKENESETETNKSSSKNEENENQE